MEKVVIWFKDIRKDDTLLVGGKGANLGEMVSINMPIPPGFVVSAVAYRHFLEANGLDKKIKEALAGLDTSQVEKTQDVAVHIKKLITTAPIPKEISKPIIQAYFELKKPLVAVRSSATSEDSKDASFAGQNETFLNVSGEASLVDFVRRCWASLFEGRSIFYRHQRHIDHLKAEIAVVVQTMVESDSSGIIFSLDPVTNNKNRIIIESIFGLGEYIVQGKITPDHYEVNKQDLKIVEKQIAKQEIMLVRDKSGRVKQVRVDRRRQNVQKISDDLIVRFAQLSKDLEKHYYFPQDSEFAVHHGQAYLVQTRPITTTKLDKFDQFVKLDMSHKVILLEGAPASPGIKSGPVKILASAKEIDKLKSGEVLVAQQTNPDYVPAMKKAGAIITDRGGRTSHAAIVSRELGIPCVVGTEKATMSLKDGEVVTVDGTEGKVYKGGIEIKTVTQSHNKPIKIMTDELKTATKVYVNLAEPEKAKEIAALDCDGVGLLRAEFMLAGIGIHPKKIIEERKQEEYVNTLAQKMTMFAEAFYPRPVVYRATDFKTNEYRSLKGGEKYEPEEANPMLGFRGAFRYIVEPEVFKMEIEAIKKVRDDKGFKNLWLMIPFCRTVSELARVKSHINLYGLQRSANFKLWMMCEIPANVLLIEDFLKVGIDGISIGSNDLTMLTLGVDRDNENVAREYNELDEAVLWSFERVIKACRKADVTCSMCGQAPSDYPKLTEKLVEWGITSVSVNPDVIAKTRDIVYHAERTLLTSK
ncbi:MAG: phosphoenolpyruvate synthase [Patescibacteria group bacterium]|nr:phosphoenolpyruvate synthase [Patescibacteria group bacterium]MCL5432340.1 phosphoenolpyruvate synthase [Patescibacteria group bacterium]